MAKQKLITKQTNLSAPGANGQQLEQTFTVDDSFLPSPEELQRYKEINPDIVKLLIDASRNEQDHRHHIDRLKMKTIKKEGNMVHVVNITGMALAFIIMIAGLGLSAFLVYKEKEIVGTIFAGATILIAVTTFLNHVKDEKKRN